MVPAVKHSLIDSYSNGTIADINAPFDSMSPTSQYFAVHQRTPHTKPLNLTTILSSGIPLPIKLTSYHRMRMTPSRTPQVIPLLHHSQYQTSSRCSTHSNRSTTPIRILLRSQRHKIRHPLSSPMTPLHKLCTKPTSLSKAKMINP